MAPADNRAGDHEPAWPLPRLGFLETALTTLRDTWRGADLWAS